MATQGVRGAVCGSKVRVQGMESEGRRETSAESQVMDHSGGLTALTDQEHKPLLVVLVNVLLPGE